MILCAFRWVFLSDTLNYNHIAFDWILDGWDFVNTQSSSVSFIASSNLTSSYLLSKISFPEKYMVNLLTESKNKDSIVMIVIHLLILPYLNIFLLILFKIIPFHLLLFLKILIMKLLL